MKEGDGLMNITRLTNNRICTILRDKSLIAQEGDIKRIEKGVSIKK